MELGSPGPADGAAAATPAAPGDPAPTEQPVAFMASGIPDLDFILGGGLVPGSLTMVIGPPGCGKTILAQQLGFHVARQGGKVLVLTTLPEPHVKLLANLRTLEFFDEALIGDRIELLNVYRQLREDFAGAGAMLLRLVRERRATLLILDSLDSVRDLAGGDMALRELIYELSAGLGLLGVTVVIVSALEPQRATQYPELTIADHIIMLRAGLHGARGVRTLEVIKMRGAAQRAGLHHYRIDARGLSVYPRQETIPLPPEAAQGDGRVAFGLDELDRMMGGGAPRGSTTLLVGNPSTGKTLLALQFLADGCRRGEPGLYLSFQETERQLLAKARSLNISTASPGMSGCTFLYRVPAEFDADELAADIRARIAAGSVKRLVIDSLPDLLGGLVDEDRRLSFLMSLMAYARNAGVTACCIQEITGVAATEPHLQAIGYAAYADNIVLLRHLEFRAELHRIISILKMRNSDHDRAIREFTIDARGLTILTAQETGSGVLDAIGPV